MVASKRMDATYFTLIFCHFVLEPLFALGIDFNIVPAKDLEGLLERALVGIVGSYRVSAMVGHVLATMSREQLQEGKLVAVRFVRELWNR